MLRGLPKAGRYVFSGRSPDKGRRLSVQDQRDENIRVLCARLAFVVGARVIVTTLLPAGVAASAGL